ncbi:MAG: hypothetical protein IPO63_04375 [Bacteroidetes bacterium]|nr:hypothetical protein [Bacteroidota bacterium]
MKKNILLFTLLLFGFKQYGFAQAEKFNFTWTFHFEIASYSQDCNSGFGLCFVPPKFNFRTVEAGVTLEEQKIFIHINRNSLHENFERELLRLTQFPIQAGTTLPEEISRKLGFRSEIVLRSGYCPIKISDDFISIICLME